MIYLPIHITTTSPFYKRAVPHISITLPQPMWLLILHQNSDWYTWLDHDAMIKNVLEIIPNAARQAQMQHALDTAEKTIYY